MSKQIVILTDYSGYLWSNHVGTKESYVISSVDIGLIKGYLEELLYQVEIYDYSSVPEDKDWTDVYVLYASSERRGGFYKGYIEDILLNLESRGAILVPKFQYFRAHENKNFAELLRKTFRNEKLRYPHSNVYGCYEELEKNFDKIKYPCVLKSANGSGSKGVSLAHNEQELKENAKKFSAHSYFNYEYTYLKRFFEFGIGYQIKKNYHELRGLKSHYKLVKDYTNKFIVQDFIEGLSGDYKVLYFAEKYYVLYRQNRDADFRASGSGKFVYPQLSAEVTQVLNFAKECVAEFGIPMLSMDIATAGGKCYLIEYQCVCFGTYTLEFSEQYYQYASEEKRWNQVSGTSDLEKEIARSLDFYINMGKDA